MKMKSLPDDGSIVAAARAREEQQMTPELHGTAHVNDAMVVAPEMELQLSFLPNKTLVWQQGPAVGTGRFGQVVLGLRIPSADFLAVKQIFIQEELEHGNDTSSLCMQRMLPLAKIEREVEIVQSIQHPNIVQFLGCERSGHVYRLFMEFVPAGSLSKLLKELGPFQESAVRHFVRQLTQGVAYLHRVGVAHRDLKCANLLLADDGTVKIADFGAAKRAHEDSADDVDDDDFKDEHDTARSVREGLGSPYWMAPELVRAERGADAWRKSDVWGIGCVMLELLTGKPPWDNHSNPLTAMFHIASKDAIPRLPSTLSDWAKSFLESCFDKNPATRPSAAELLIHPFLTGSNSAALPRRSSKSSPQTGVIVVGNQVELRSAEESDLAGSLPATGGSESPRSVVWSSSSSEHAASRNVSSCHSSVSSDDGSDTPLESAAYSSDDDRSERATSSAVQSRASSVRELVVSRRPSAATFVWTEIGRVRALADYNRNDENELSLVEGEMLVVSGVNEFGWWRGKHVADSSSTSPADTASAVAGEIGWFPCTYVEWIPRDTPFTVRMQHVPEVVDVVYDALVLAEGDTVDVVHCEWRDERLWAYGAMVGNAQQGWFPFSCVVDETSTL